MAEATTKAPEKASETSKAKGETAIVTARDGGEVPVAVAEWPKDDLTKQFFNNSDWPLFQRNEFVRAKPLEVEEGKEDERKYQVFDRDGKESTVDAEEFEQDFLVVKGPHKSEF